VTQSFDADNPETLLALALAILADLSLSEESAHLAMLLLLSRATDKEIDDVLNAMKARPSVAAVAGRVLRRLGSVEIIPRLGKLIGDRALPPGTRAVAVGVIGHVGHASGKSVLLLALGDGDEHPEVLCEIAYGLGNIQLREGATDAASALVPLLGHKSADVRLAAIEGLGNMWARQAADEIDKLSNDRSMSKAGVQVGARAAAVARMLRTQ